MRIPLWRVLLFALVIIFATYAVFPNESEMLSHYMKSGRMQDAARLAPKLVAEDPTPRNLRLAAEVYRDMGMPEKSIEMLRRLLKKNPDDTGLLETLATYLQWDLRREEAAEIYEELAALQPESLKWLQWLIAYYRLKGEHDRESLAIARLVPRLKDQAASLSGTIMPLFWEQLLILSRERLEHGSDPLRDHLMRGLYVLWQQYNIELEDGDMPDSQDYLVYAFEYFVDTDELEQGERFAAALDARFDTGIQNRLLLATVMSWRRLYDLMADYLAAIERHAPQDRALLQDVANAALASGQGSRRRQELEQKLGKDPAAVRFRLQLARLHAASGDYSRAVQTLEQGVAAADAPGPLLQEMLALSLRSGDKELMRQALSKADGRLGDDPGALREAALVSLTLQEPDMALKLYRKMTAKLKGMEEPPSPASTIALARDAMEILQYQDADVLRTLAQYSMMAQAPAKAVHYYLAIADKGQASEQDLLQLLQAALFSDDAALIAKAMDRVAPEVAAKPELMDNPQFRLAMANGFVALDQPEKAFHIFRQVAEQDQSEEGLEALIDAAVFSGKEEFADIALQLTRQRQALTPRRMRRLAEAYLAADKPRKAYPLLRQLVQEEGRAEDLVRLLEAAAFANANDLAQEAASIAERQMRTDKRARALAQEQLLSLYLWSGQELKAAEMLAQQATASPKNVSLLLHTAQAYSFAGKTQKALEYYKRALELRPEDPEILAKVAEFAGYVDDSKAMVAAYEKLLQKGLLGERGRLLLARAYADKQLWQQALPLLEPLLQDPELPQYEGLLLARALVKTGADEASAEVYQRLARENEDDIPYLSQLGAEALFDDQQEVALQLFDRVLRLAPKNATALKGKAMIEAENNDAESAIQTYNRYNTIYENDPESRFQLAELYSIEDFPDEAAKQYDKVLQTLRRQGSLRPPSQVRGDQAQRAARRGLRHTSRAQIQKQDSMPPPLASGGQEAAQTQMQRSPPFPEQPTDPRRQQMRGERRQAGGVRQ